MAIQVFGQGAVQSAYPSYVFIDIRPTPAGKGSTILVWPNTYIDLPYTDPTGQFYQVAAANIEVNTAAANVNTIRMPDARKTSVGQTITMINTGVSGFNVLANDGITVIVNVPISDANHANTVWFLLTDNSTANGTWETVTMGAGISQATALALAGNGLTAIGDKLNTYIHIIPTNVVPVIDATYRGKEIVWTGGAANIPLPAIGTVPEGFYLSFNNQSPTDDIIVIQPGEPGTKIDKLLTFSLSESRSLTIISDGTNWNTLGYGASPTSVVTVNSLNVSGGANVNLSIAQANSNIQIYNGTLTGNITVFFPANKAGFWFIENSTTGNFTLSVQVFGPIGASYVVPRGSNQIFYSDGGAGGLFAAPTSLLLGNGTAVNPSLSFINNPNTGIYSSPVSGNLIISTGGLNRAIFDSSPPSTTVSRMALISPNGCTIQMASTNTQGVLAISNTPFGTLPITFMTISPTTGAVTLLQPLTLSAGLSAPLAINYGGSGANTQATAANNILPPTPAKGTIVWWNGTDWANLPVGTNGQFLKVIDGTGTLGWVT
jgi:hypothetical protein